MSTETETKTDWDLVAERLESAKAIAWDTCHKIYLLMDDEQVGTMRGYEYDPLITRDQMSTEGMTAQVREWYDESCGYRFINAVSTNKEDSNKGFETLIPQRWDEGEGYL